MTTVVYSHKEKKIGFDSRITQGGVVLSDQYCKMKEANGTKFVFSGAPSDIDMFIDMFFGIAEGGLPEVACIYVDGDEAYTAMVGEDAQMSILKLELDFAVGSGGDWAMAGLDHGLCVEDAIKYAQERDCYSGGDINVIELGGEDE